MSRIIQLLDRDGRPVFAPADREKPVDVLLLKLPNHNIDYPHLGLPTLTGAVRRAGLVARQEDVNLSLRDHLLTERGLREITYDYLPELTRRLLGSPRDYATAKRILVQLLAIDDNIGFARVEAVKRMMQARRYDELLTDENGSFVSMHIFVICSMLHNIIDQALTADRLGLENPVTRFLSGKVDEAVAINPRVVGFSVLQIQRPATLWFAKRLRERFDGTIAIGGPDASTFAEAYLENYPYLDLAFVKEAELSLIRFLKGADPSTIPGVAYRDEHGQVRKTKESHNLQLSNFRPDFDDFQLDKFLLPTLPLSATRGCAYARCKFCNHFKTYSGYYANDTASTADNIEFLANRYGTKFFHLVDDMLEKDVGDELTAQLTARGLDVMIITYARFESKLDADTMQRWRRGGIRAIEWGLESASQRMLKSMHKGISMKQVQAMLDRSAEVGILNKLMMFHNYPGETPDDVRESVAFVKRNALDRTIRPFFTMRGKCEIRLDTVLEVESRDPANSDFWKRFERTSELSSLIEYADFPNYGEKTEHIEAFIGEMSEMMADRDIYSVNDENMSFDLVVLDMLDRGKTPVLKCV